MGGLKNQWVTWWTRAQACSSVIGAENTLRIWWRSRQLSGSRWHECHIFGHRCHLEYVGMCVDWFSPCSRSRWPVVVMQCVLVRHNYAAIMCLVWQQHSTPQQGLDCAMLGARTMTSVHYLPCTLAHHHYCTPSYTTLNIYAVTHPRS